MQGWVEDVKRRMLGLGSEPGAEKSSTVVHLAAMCEASVCSHRREGRPRAPFQGATLCQARPGVCEEQPFCAGLVSSGVSAGWADGLARTQCPLPLSNSGWSQTLSSLEEGKEDRLLPWPRPQEFSRVPAAAHLKEAGGYLQHSN